MTDPSGVIKYSADNTDCDDSDPNNFFANTEWIDDQDNDCDGIVDEGPYVIGDTGPAGGIVFYANWTQQHGLEVSPVDLATAFAAGAEYGCWEISIFGARGTAIGTGAQNTAAILAANCKPLGPTHDVAADIVSAYSLNDYDDWFLPSKDELNALYTARDVVDGISDKLFWSSSEYHSIYAWGLNYDGSWSRDSKHVPRKVRAVRAF